MVLGVLTVTFATGLTESVQAYGNALNPTGADLIDVYPGGGPGTGAPAPKAVPGSRGQGAPTASSPKLTAAQDYAMIKALPGTLAVAAFSYLDVGIVGQTGSAHVTFVSESHNPRPQPGMPRPPSRPKWR